MKALRRIMRVVFWLVLLVLLPVRQGTLQGIDCISRIEQTLTSAQTTCPNLDFNSLCYAASPVTLSGSVDTLSLPGTKVDLGGIESVGTTPTDNGLAGSAVLYGQAGPSATQQVVIVLLGNATIKKIDANAGDSQIAPLSETNLLTSTFDLSTSIDSLNDCASQPPGMLIAKSVGSKPAVITVSGLTITFSGVVVLHMSANNVLDLLVFDGDAWIESTTITIAQALEITLDTENPGGSVSLSQPRSQTLDEVPLTSLILNPVNQFVLLQAPTTNVPTWTAIPYVEPTFSPPVFTPSTAIPTAIPPTIPVPTISPVATFCPDPDC